MMPYCSGQESMGMINGATGGLGGMQSSDQQQYGLTSRMIIPYNKVAI